MNRRAFAVSFLILLAIAIALRETISIWAWRVDSALWMAVCLPRLRDIGWPWWFLLVGLAPGGSAALSVFLLFAPTGYSNAPTDRRLIAGSGLALVVFGWLQVAAMFGLFVWAEQEDAAGRAKVAPQVATPSSSPRPSAAPVKTATPSPTPVLPPPSVRATPTPHTPAPPVFASSVNLSKKLAIAKYPALAVANSAFNKRFVAEYNEWLKDRDARLDRADWPELLAEDVAEDLAGQ